MRCRYCNERLSFFKSLAGSGFCSKEHQELFEKSQAETAFSRLLDFVEKEPKPSRSRGKPKPTKASEPDLQAISAVSQTAASIPEPAVAQVPAPEAPAPPVTGFLPEPVAAPAGADILPARAAGDILGPEFPIQPPALPAWQIGIRHPDFQALDSDQPASEAAEKPTEPERTNQSSAGNTREALLEPVPAQAAGPEPITTYLVGEPVALNPVAPQVLAIQPVPLGTSGPQPVSATLPALQAVVSETGPPVATRAGGPSLEIRDTNSRLPLATIRAVRPRDLDPRLPGPEGRPPALVGHYSLPQDDFSPVQPLNDGSRLAKLACLSPITPDLLTQIDQQHWAGSVGNRGLRSTPLETSATHLFAGLDSLADKNSAAPAIRMAGAVIRAILGKTRTSLNHPPNSSSPVKVQNPAQSQRAELPDLRAKSRTAQSIPAVDGNSAVRAARFAKVIQPAIPRFDLVGLLGTKSVLRQIEFEPQNVAAVRDSAMPALQVQRGCVMPEIRRPGVKISPEASVLHSLPELQRGRTPHSNLAIAAAALRPVSRELRLSAAPQSPQSLCAPAMEADQTSRAIPTDIRIGAIRNYSSCSVRVYQRECRVPQVEGSIKTSLAAGQIRETRLETKHYLSEPMLGATHVSAAVGLRFASARFDREKPVLSTSDTAREFTFQPRDSKTKQHDNGREAQGVSRAKPAAPSPLRLVARPRPGRVSISVRRPALVVQSIDVVVPEQTSSATVTARAASMEDPNRLTSLPRPASDLLFLSSRSSPHAISATLPITLAEQDANETPASPGPTPLRVQPASMLALPGPSIADLTRIQWRARAGWAMIRASGVNRSDQDQQLVSSSLLAFANVLKMDASAPPEAESPQLSPESSAILFNLGSQTPAPRVPAASALPRRRGPTLPVASGSLQDLAVAER